MDDAKRDKRLLRYLRLLAKRPAALRETGDPATWLLEFPGERSVRFARTDCEHLRRRGWIDVAPRDEAMRVDITGEGRAALRRSEGGGFAAQHRHLRGSDICVDGRREGVVVNDDESPLSSLARLKDGKGRPWLDRVEASAGERLRADFERAMLQPRVTASWDFSRMAKSGKGGRNGGADLTDSALAARERVHRAIEAVGPELGGALLDMCCFLKGLEQVERERGWPRRSAKLMLKTGLAMLDRHYHPPQPGTRHARRILHWGADGFRPSL
jgi:hypothetical protein